MVGCFTDTTRPSFQHGSPTRLAVVLAAVLSLQLCLAMPFGTAIISQLPPGVPDMQLLHALQNQNVSKIMLAGDYKVGSQFDSLSGPHVEGIPRINIRRNVTLTSVPGVEPQPMLDFQFKMSVVELCDTCTFTISNITVKDDRMGANAQWDFFLGEGDSVLYATNVVRNRLSCTDIDTAMQLVLRTKRSPRFLGPNGTTQQIFDDVDVWWRGQLFPRTLHLVNYSVDFPRHYNGGYSVVLQNVTRMCRNFVDAVCLSRTDADMCVFEQIQSLLSAEAQQDKQHKLSGAAIAGIVVAVVVAAAAVAGLAWGLRRRKQQQLSRPGATKSLLRPDVESGVSQQEDLTVAKDSARDQGSGGSVLVPSKRSNGEGSSSSSGLGQALGARPYPPPPLPGSSVSLGGQSSSFVGTSLSELTFGVLLGSGSFGRVYKARWGDIDVAVKVIEHDRNMAAVVANEVSIMLSCKHPNVVCAYHYATYSHNPDGSTSCMPMLGISDELHQHQQQQPSLQQHSGSNGSAWRQQQLPGTGSNAGSYNSSIDRPVPVIPGPRQPYQGPPILEAAPGHENLQLAAQQANHQQQQQESLTASSSPNPCLASQTAPDSQAPEQQPHQQQQQQQQPADGSSSSQQQQQQQQLGFDGSGVDSAGRPGSGLDSWEHEGGFWPAGPPLLPEQQGPLDEVEHSLVTTWLIQEYCDAGTLAKQANTWQSQDDGQMIKRLLLLQDVVKGLSYLHSKNIVHGDLNARNVLVASNQTSPCGLTAKLADLGLSRSIKQHNTHHTTCTVGTMSHMPPELLRHGRMSHAVDIYAFGVMMWEVYTREIAFRELHYGQFFETVVLRNLRPKVPPGMPGDYRLLMERCWAAEPSDRPTTKALLNCIALMVADRQHSLGLPVRCSLDLVDHEFGKQRASGNSSGSNILSKATMQQLATHHTQQQQQQHQSQNQSQTQSQADCPPTPQRQSPVGPTAAQPGSGQATSSASYDSGSGTSGGPKVSSNAGAAAGAAPGAEAGSATATAAAAAAGVGHAGTKPSLVQSPYVQDL